MAQGWNEDVVLRKIKQAVLSRGGPNAFKATIRSFRAMDVNDDHCLDREEFANGVNRTGAKLTKQEIEYLFKVFDKNKDGTVSIDEFVGQLIGGLNPRRKKVVDRAYKKFDVTGDGVITMDDLRGTYNAAKNPLVLRGEKTEEEVMRDFLDSFDSEVKDGKVTREEFYAYYSGVSASIPHDDYFEALVLKAWDIDDSTKPRLDATERDWSATGGDPLSVQPQVRGELLSQTLGKADKTYNASHMQRKQPDIKPNPSVLPDYITTKMRDFPPYDAETIKKSDPIRANEPAVFSPTGNPTVDNIRKKILKRAGPEGFHGLARSFRIIDKNRDQQLTKEEIDMGMKRYGVPLSKIELDTLYSYLDRDSGGVVDTTEFYRAIRGPITQKCRRDILRVAFSRMDTDKSGILTLQEVAQKYDASQHPQVLKGQKSENDVIREFINDWDKDGNDTITWDEWLEYYANISCTIDSDQYFELMIRNAWHISGGVGAAANTSCRRVLVIYNDDTQRVVEIEDDIGVRADDIAEMKRQLQRQGHKNIKKIELTG